MKPLPASAISSADMQLNVKVEQPGTYGYGCSSEEARNFTSPRSLSPRATEFDPEPALVMGRYRYGADTAQRTSQG